MMEQLKRYEVVLKQFGVTDEFDWSEMEVYGFLGARINEATASDAIAEADEKGTTTRAITYALGNTGTIVVSPR